MERMDYIDMAKGFAIIAITLGHIYENNFIRIWLCSFHLSLFFIVSGILIKQTNTEKRKLNNIIVARFKRLIVPYFAFELFAIIIWMIRNHECTIGALRWNIIDTILLHTKAGATWFLPTLFVSEIVFIILVKLIKKDKILMVISALIYVIPFLVESKNHYVIVFFRCFTAIGFLACGYFIYNVVTKKYMKNMYIAIAVLMCIFLSQTNGVVDLYMLNFNNPLIYTVCSMIGSIILMFSFKNIKINALNFFGRNSLIIMATQQIILENIINLITGINRYSFLSGAFVLTIVMIIEIPVIYIINNYAPWMLGQLKRKNNRTSIYK